MDRNYLLYLTEKWNAATGVHKARRTSGVFSAAGSFFTGGTIDACKIERGIENHQEIHAIADLLSKGLLYLQVYQDHPTVRFALEAAASEETTPIAWMHDHDVIAEIIRSGDDSRILRMDAGWVNKLCKTKSQEIAEGLIVLGAVIDLYLLAVLGGANQREVLHTLRDFIVMLPAKDIELLHAVLQEKVIDPNHSFSLMITLSEDKKLAQSLEQLDLSPFLSIRTSVLCEAGNVLERELFKQRREGGEINLDGCLGKIAAQHPIAGEEIERLLQAMMQCGGLDHGNNLIKLARLMEETIKWRDRWITWLLHQSQLDLPYNQTNVVKLLKQDIADIDEKRALINESISTGYDVELEGENIKRLSRWARETGIKLVAGRLSRAFGNQSQLLSVAKILGDKVGLLPSIKKLYDASMNEPALQTFATRLLHLIQQNKPTPLAQTVGALNAYEEALFDYQTREFKKLLAEKDDASRRINWPL